MEPEEIKFGREADQAWSQLAAYLAGEGTPQHRAEFETWVQASSARVALVQRAHEQWTRGLEPSPADVDQAWAIARAQLGIDNTSRGQTSGEATAALGLRKSRSKRAVRWPWIGAFAGAVAIASAIGLMRTPRAPLQGETRTYQTASGQQATVVLHDGTRVTLAPQTTLRLVNFGASTRTVAIDRGEALFDVRVADARTPFVVQSGAATARVLGTLFYMRAANATNGVRVGVASGKISLSGRSTDRNGVTVTAGQVGVITDSTVQVNTVTNSQSGPELLNGELVFRRTPVPVILDKLSRWYGYQFRLTDSTIAQQVVTAWISTESTASALSTLEQILNVNFTVVGDTVTLTPQRGRSVPGKSNRRTYDAWTPNTEVGR